MMEHVLARLDERGCPVVLLDATEAGARPCTSRWVSWTTRTPTNTRAKSAAAADRASGRVELMTRACCGEVTAFDRDRFGADRGKLLQLLLAETPDRALFAATRRELIAGFAFARVVLGPWVAEDSATAEQLLDAAVRTSAEPSAHVLVPRSNQRAVELLERRGLSPHSPVTAYATRRRTQRRAIRRACSAR